MTMIVTRQKSEEGGGLRKITPTHTSFFSSSTNKLVDNEEKTHDVGGKFLKPDSVESGLDFILGHFLGPFGPETYQGVLQIDAKRRYRIKMKHSITTRRHYTKIVESQPLESTRQTRI